MPEPEGIKRNRYNITTLFGKRYMWLRNHEGKLQLHSLERPPKDDPTAAAVMRHAAKLDETRKPK